jgi:predicted O-methyltransferase YrrM
MSAKQLLARSVLRVAHSGPGRTVVRHAVRATLMLAVDLDESGRLAQVQRLPEQLEGFEDLAFLFSSSQLNYGIAQLTFEEAAYLFSLARSLGPAQLAEIGRFKGGSTLVLGTAMHPEARLDSYDLHAVPTFPGAALDAELTAVLKRYGLAPRVTLHVADSTTVEPPAGCALVFVDGDHSYAGVKADVEHWVGALAPGGHVLLHDVSDPDRVAEGGAAGPRLLAAELDAGAFGVRGVARVGTIAHYVVADDA